MTDTDRRDPRKRTPNRRQVLGLAATATGGAAAAWLYRDRTRPRQADSDPTEPAEPPSGASGPTVAAPTATPESQVTALVGNDGFNIRVGSVRVFASKGVAAAGTQISVSTPATPIPAEFRAFSSAVGRPVRIVLGDGQQPQRPVTVVFDLQGTELASDVNDEAPLTAVARSEGSSILEPVAGTWDAREQTLTIVTDRLMRSPDEALGSAARKAPARPATAEGRSSGHLMGAATTGQFGFGLFDFWPIRFDLGKFVTDAIAGLLGLRFTEPACAYDPLALGSTTYTVDRSGADVMWPCLRAGGDRVVVDLHSNSIIPWAVKTAPSVSGDVSGDFFDLSPGLAAIYEAVFAVMGDQRSVVMPGNTTRFRFDAADPPERVEARQAPGLFVFTATLQMVNAVFDALGMGTVAKAVIESFDAFGCLTQIINTTYQEDGQRIARGVVLSTLSCLKELLDDGAKIGSRFLIGPAIVVVGLCVSGAGLIIGAIEGIIREVTGTASTAFTISRSTPAPGVGADADELYTLHIRANTEGGGATVGARFTVTTEDGEVLGRCAQEADTVSPPAYCRMDVPNGTTVIVWQDPESIPAGYAPVENPITFDTTYPTTTPHKIDVAFFNVPQDG